MIALLFTVLLAYAARYHTAGKHRPQTPARDGGTTDKWSPTVASLAGQAGTPATADDHTGRGGATDQDWPEQRNDLPW